MMIVRHKIVVLDITDGSPLSKAYIEVVRVDGTVEAFLQADKMGGFIITNKRNWHSCKIYASGYGDALVSNIEIKSFRKTVVKLIPDMPIAYLEKLEFKPGDHMNVYAHSKLDYHISVYRHGLKKLCVYEASCPAICQEIKGSDDVSGRGLSWKLATSFKVEKEWSSGLYSLVLNDSSGKANASPFVITSNQIEPVSSRLLVLANVSTWQAYNIWGGRSRYRRFDDDSLFIIPHVLVRILTALKRRIFSFLKRRSVSGVSLQPSWISKRLAVTRPLTNPWLLSASPHEEYLDHLAANEWRGLAWLESMGIKYEYCSDASLGTQDHYLNNFDAVLLLSHPEYWVKESFDNLCDAHLKRSLSLINFGGNSFYQQVKYDQEDGMYCQHGLFFETYKNTSSLTNTCTDLSITDFAPFSVNKSQTKSWVFKNLPIKFDDEGLALIGEKSLINCELSKSNLKYSPHTPGVTRNSQGGCGASGWEVEKIINNLDQSYIVLAQGVNKGGGADMILKEWEGKIFFSSSSISYVGSLLIDESISQISKLIVLRALRNTNMSNEVN